MSDKSTAYCPGCGTRIRFRSRPQIGDQTSCPECGDLLMVVDSSPIELDWVDGAGYSAEYSDYDDQSYDFDDLDNWEEV